MMNKKIVCLFFLFVAVFFVTTLAAQEGEKKHVYLEVAPRFGKMIPNSSGQAFQPLGYGFDAKVGIQSSGVEAWQRYHACPRYGFSLRYLSFDDQVLDHKLALFGFMNAPIFRSNKFSLNYQLGLGLSYFSNPYDVERNPTNRWIGTRVNLYAAVEFTADYQLSERLALSGALQFSHSSNGTIKQPNLGVNMFCPEVGLRYFLQPTDPKSYRYDWKSNLDFKPENQLFLSVAPGYKECKQDSLYYFTTTFRIAYERQFSSFLKYGAGIDISYNPSIQAYAPDGHEKQALEYFTPAAQASFEVMYGQLAFHVGFAWYLYLPYDYYEKFYERAGIKYYLTKSKNHYVGAFVKAHAGSVDYIEWTYGIRIF